MSYVKDLLQRRERERREVAIYRLKSGFFNIEHFFPIDRFCIGTG